MAPGVLLQDLQGVIGPLAFAVELNVARQAVVLHLRPKYGVSSQDAAGQQGNRQPVATGPQVEENQKFVPHFRHISVNKLIQ